MGRKKEAALASRVEGKILKILAESRDSVLEIGEEGRNYPYYLPAVMRLLRDKPALFRYLIIVATPEEVMEIEDFSRLLQASKKEEAHLLAVGTNANLKKENSLIDEPRSVLVGTPERIIDHLRRGNLDLGKVERVLIDCPSEGNLDVFIADIQFIYSKTGIKPKTLLVTSRLRPEAETFGEILKNPRILSREQWLEPLKLRLFVSPGTEDKAALAVKLFLAGKDAPPSLALPRGGQGSAGGPPKRLRAPGARGKQGPPFPGKAAFFR